MNYQFRLFADLNFSNKEHNDLLPIGYDPQKTSIIFTDIFDGQNHTISNIINYEGQPTYHVGGIFYGNRGTIKNIKVMKTFRILGMALVAVMLGFAMSACSDDDDDYLKELEKE